MILGELLFALGIALVLTIIFAFILKRPGPWSMWWGFFLVIFLVSWAAAIWITPRGPAVVGVYWLPVIFTALLFAILLAAGTPIEEPESKVETISQAEEKEEVRGKVADIFLWLFLLSLAAVIILGFFVR